MQIATTLAFHQFVSEYTKWGMTICWESADEFSDPDHTLANADADSLATFANWLIQFNAPMLHEIDGVSDVEAMFAGHIAERETIVFLEHVSAAFFWLLDDDRIVVYNNEAATLDCIVPVAAVEYMPTITGYTEYDAQTVKVISVQKDGSGRVVHTSIEDALQEITELLRYVHVDGEAPDQITISFGMMSQRELDNLKEFEGY